MELKSGPVLLVAMLIGAAACTDNTSPSTVAPSSSSFSTTASSYSSTLPRGSTTIAEASRPETVIIGQAAGENRFESSRVLAEYMIERWRLGTW